MFVLTRMEPIEALETGIPIEVLILRGIIPSKSLKSIHQDERIVAEAVREGEALVEKFIPPCFDAQSSTSSPDEF